MEFLTLVKMEKKNFLIENRNKKKMQTKNWEKKREILILDPNNGKKSQNSSKKKILRLRFNFYSRFKQISSVQSSVRVR